MGLIELILDFTDSKPHIWHSMNKDYSFLATDGEKIRITAYFDEKLISDKTIVFIHGFKGFKDWGFGPYLSNYFAEKGFFVITFNFSHNGIGENKTEFTEIDKFAINSYSRELRELDELIDKIRDGYFPEIVVNTKIGLIGHSRGGAIALLSASGRKDIEAVVTWASISNFDRYSNRQKEEWRREGYFNMLNTRTGQIMRLDVSILDEIERDGKGLLNLETALRNLNKPLLIAHGDQDLAVKINEAEELYSWSDKSMTEFFKLIGTGHTFDVVHPFAGSNVKFEKLLEITAKFFIKHLN